jgi:23S rRNA (cytidine1920-2'-O)/16S rRNA (cytidine1409-2'-O)-methyltransferase
MRLDIYITAAGAAKSRNRAQRIISEGKIYVNGKKITKSSYEVVEGDKVELRGEDMRYVSRGGLKLEHAIDSFKIDCKDRVCIDIGASTGGFTDCLLQHGAKKVYAIDSGRDQLDSSLLTDERVVSIESFNARELTLETVGEYCSLAVMDVSFISQTLLYDSVCRVLGEDGMFVSLILTGALSKIVLELTVSADFLEIPFSTVGNFSCLYSRFSISKLGKTALLTGFTSIEGLVSPIVIAFLTA